MEPLPDIREGERIRPHIRQLFPSQGDGDWSALPGPCGIGFDGGRPAHVPHVIDKYLPGPSRFGHHRGEPAGKAPCEKFGHGLCEGFYIVPRAHRHYRGHEVHSLAAGCLYKAFEPKLIEKPLQQKGRLNDLFPGNRGVRVDIEDYPVRVLDGH